jgi:tetratricopeptide (TPR) repeat protein
MRNMHDRELGECHPDTLSDVYAIAELYERQGRWAEAEALISWVWETKKRFLGTEHCQTRRTMGNFAMVYSVQGRTEESKVLKKQLIKICKKLLGDKDPETLLAISELSIELAEQGKWKKAEEHTQEALKGRKEVLSEYHATANSMNSLAAIYQHKGVANSSRNSVSAGNKDRRKHIRRGEPPYAKLQNQSGAYVQNS